MCSILSKELNFVMNPVASVIWDMISVPLKSAGDFFCIQLAFHCTLVGWKIQSIICSLRYTVRREKTLHATNQPTTRPAATDKKKVQPEWQQAEYQHLWTDEQVGNIQAERLPRLPKEQQPAAQASRSRAAEVWMHEQTDALQCRQPHISWCANQGAQGLFWTDKGWGWVDWSCFK